MREHDGRTGIPRIAYYGQTKIPACAIFGRAGPTRVRSGRTGVITQEHDGRTGIPTLAIVVEQGVIHGFTAADQELPHQVSTVEHGSLPSRVCGIMDEDIQWLEGGGLITWLRFTSFKYRLEVRRGHKHRERSVGMCPRYRLRGRGSTKVPIHWSHESIARRALYYKPFKSLLEAFLI